MSYLLLYQDVKTAIQAEEIFQANHIHVRIIATPESIKATCGFSLELTTDNLNHSLENANLETIEGIYEIRGSGLTKTYHQVSL